VQAALAQVPVQIAGEAQLDQPGVQARASAVRRHQLVR
jgi:hypothetical protein